jgi:hypothetical protein
VTGITGRAALQDALVDRKFLIHFVISWWKEKVVNSRTARETFLKMEWKNIDQILGRKKMQIVEKVRRIWMCFSSPKGEISAFAVLCLMRTVQIGRKN